jgi:hypothetical protein
MTGSDGYLPVAIIVIKDSKIPSVQLRYWSNDGGYQLWTTFVPNPKRAASRIKPVEVSTAHRRVVAAARVEVRNIQANDNFIDDLEVQTNDEDDDNDDNAVESLSSLDTMIMEKIAEDITIPAMRQRDDAMVQQPPAATSHGAVANQKCTGKCKIDK